MLGLFDVDWTGVIGMMIERSVKVRIVAIVDDILFLLVFCFSLERWESVSFV